LDGVCGLFAAFITLGPILKAWSKNLNQCLDVAGVGVLLAIRKANSYVGGVVLDKCTVNPIRHGRL